MTAKRADGFMMRASPDSQLARGLALLAIALVVPGLVGWVLGIPVLIQPLDTFAPMRAGGTVLLPLGAAALLAKLAGRPRRAWWLASGTAAIAGLAMLRSLAQGPMLLDQLLRQRLGPAFPIDAGPMPPSMGLLVLLYATALLLLLRPGARERTIIVAGGLAATQVALAGVLFMAQLSGLLDGTPVQSWRAPLHGLLATLALGVALLDRLSRRDARSPAAPRWVPVLAGVSSALVVIVLWQALGARETAQALARSEINAQAIDRAVQRQYRAVERGLGRSAAYLRESPGVDDPVWRTGLPRLVDETDGLEQILWFDSTGTLLQSATRTAIAPSVLQAVAQHVRAARLNSQEVVPPHSTTLSPGPWPLALWLPVYSPRRSPTVLVGLINDVALIAPIAEDASRDVWVRVRAEDVTLLEVGTAARTAPRFTAPLRLGARQLMMDVAETAGTSRAPLSDVVLALGLTVSLLLAITLWLQRRIWLQAREESERFRAVFDTAFQVQLLLDLDGTVLEANRAAGELAEVSPDALRGVRFQRLPWWADDADTAVRVQERFELARAGEPQRFEVELTQGRERTQTVDFSLKPLYDAALRVVRVVVEGRDLTIRKRAEESLREISALTTMGQLAARVAHEINNPLAGIQNAFLLVRGAIPEDHPHYRFVGAIEREIARIAAVTRQLYETYRPDHVMATQSSVVLAVSDAVTFLEQVNRGRPVRIVSDTTQAPSMVPVPDALLRQTLYNLVQNAVDVSPPNGTIVVRATQEGDVCVLRVSDEGPGIPPAIRERIFDPFFSTKDRTMKTGGMGIGLALVRQSVLAVGGQILVHDRPEGGTEFEVRLPMTPIPTGALK